MNAYHPAPAAAIESLKAHEELSYATAESALKANIASSNDFLSKALCFAAD